MRTWTGRPPGAAAIARSPVGARARARARGAGARLQRRGVRVGSSAREALAARAVGLDRERAQPSGAGSSDVEQLAAEVVLGVVELRGPQPEQPQQRAALRHRAVEAAPRPSRSALSRSSRGTAHHIALVANAGCWSHSARQSGSKRETASRCLQLISHMSSSRAGRNVTITQPMSVLSVRNALMMRCESGFRARRASGLIRRTRTRGLFPSSGRDVFATLGRFLVSRGVWCV